MLFGLPLSLNLGALLSDIAYYRSFELQWVNFAAWLIVGALLLGTIVLLVAFVDAVRGRGARRLLYLALFAAMWGVELINALVHARDGWASMPTGLILSAIIVTISLVAAWAGLSRPARDRS